MPSDEQRADAICRAARQQPTPEAQAAYVAGSCGNDLQLLARVYALLAPPRLEEGHNVFLLGGPKVRSTLELWRSNEQNRKKAWRMLLVLGLTGFLGAVLRLRTLQQTLDRIGRKLGLSIRAVELSDPLAAVDVDKPADHELVTAILEGRA